ncbi:MAG: NYN domain-containing protein [Bacteroidales bacterium]|nr:NYN domain-containing protein [Clostridium sp.]MCM1202997.1 NYN domain-containing protein [Bacteroidales bacterium]
MDEKKIILLIDAENTSAKYADCIIQYLSGQGDIISAQIYGDFLDNHNTKQWNNKAVEHNLQRYQADTTKAGKNAADIALVIDAMDFLHKENPADVFCIVTSDGDFTSLVDRIRKEAIEVIGIGKKDASPRLRKACSVYQEFEQLEERSKPVQGKAEPDNHPAAKRRNTKDKKEVGQAEPKPAKQVESLKNIKMALNELVQQDENAGKQADLGGIKSRLQLKYPGFDERDYGYKSIREFIDKETKFKVHQEGTHAIVVSDKRENSAELENVCRFILDTYPKKVIGQHEIGSLGRKLHSRFSDFRYKDYGYGKLSAFLEELGFTIY